MYHSIAMNATYVSNYFLSTSNQWLRRAHRAGITTAMAAVSIIGTTFRGLAAAYAAVAFLKVLLGRVLLAAAGKTAFADRSLC
jgi:hypothetical protein